MDYQTRTQLIKNYKLSQDVQDFLDKNPIIEGHQYDGWYSENGKLKIK